ncbi:hypothetical protein M9Y10_025928 [Tritrichomonas musculus]|uniref:Myb-like DNA-binding domain containing protein n=1 Tax=Tritrichomonas musculus TaxID=1915356 RepID=A0ABR2H805_9EUKA
MSVTGLQALLDVSMSYINEVRDSSKSSLLGEITDSSNFPTENLTPEEISTISETLNKLFTDKINISQAAQIINPIVGSQHPMQKIAGILSITDEPIPPKPHDFMDNMSRHKTRPWNTYEDQRLLAAILRYGFENWIMIAEFVGNGRTRSQCSQRWNRGLNPKISKGTWSKEEEEKLLRLVALNGDKSWTKISMEFGNRSDVQCRYRYQQLIKENHVSNSNSSPASCSITSNDVNNVNDATIDDKNTTNDGQDKIFIVVEENNDEKEPKLQIPPLIAFSNASQQQKPPSSIIISDPVFTLQSKIQNNPSLQQENYVLPKISLPKIDGSIFMEC